MRKILLFLLLILTLLISGCIYDGTGENTKNPPPDNQSVFEEDGIRNTSDLFSKRDFEEDYDEEDSILINLNGDTAICDSSSVHISGGIVTITKEGTYILSGSLKDGLIIVNAGKKDQVRLVFRNAVIQSKTSSPVYISQADKVFITLAPLSDNILTNDGIFTKIDGNNIDGVIFSKDDLVMNGSGVLTVNSPKGHGIVSKDELTITGGTYIIHAANHGFTGKDSVKIANGNFDIDSGKDGIHSENKDDDSLGFVYIQNGTFKIISGGDGISASSQLQIDDGAFSIVAGGGTLESNPKGGSSVEGLKASKDIFLKGGSFTIDTTGDGIHSDSSIVLSGGEYKIATNDDGIHAENFLVIKSGVIHIVKSHEGFEGYQVRISGGDITLFAEEDGINAKGGNSLNKDPSSGSIEISGGSLYVNAGGDGIDANGTLTISGGYVVVCGPISGDTAILDYDVEGVITGGTFIGTGASANTFIFSSSDQGVITVALSNQKEGTVITLTDDEKKVILPPYAPLSEYNMVILSSPDLVKGRSYTLTVGSDAVLTTAN